MTRTSAVNLFAIGLALAVVSLAVAAEMRIVDATVPVRHRLRPPTAGHFGSIGNKLPLRVTVRAGNSAGGGNGNEEVDFTLTNVGKEALQLPISIHPRNLEPDDPNASYAVTVLGIYLTQRDKKECVLPGRVDLYGSPRFPETVEHLLPGESIRVITRMLPEPSLDSGTASSAVLRAHVVLEDQKVSTRDGQTFEETNEVGSAQSDEFTPDPLHDGHDPP